MLNETQNILDRLAAADREHQKEAAGCFLLRTLKHLCAFVLVAFVLDVVLHLDAGWRLGLLVALVVSVVAFSGIGWYLAFVRRNRLEHVARMLETRAPTLGSQLINLLQLREQGVDSSLSQLTRDLAGQAVENYAGELRSAPLERLARTDALRQQLKYASWALLVFAAVLAAFFRVSAVEIARFVDPFGDHPPYSFTRLEIVDPGPAGTNVLYGKGFVVKVKASGHQPKEIFLTFHPPGKPEEAVTVPMFDKGSVGFHQMLDDVRSELVVVAHTKDRASISKQARVGVILTPQLERAFVQITAPAYTRLKAEEKAYAFKGVQALAGSEVRFRLQSNRPLRDGLLEITSGERAPQKIILTNSAEKEVSGVFVATESGRLRFSLTDVDRLPSQAAWEGPLTVTYDLPPDIRIVEPERDVFVAMDFKLEAHVEEGDDYGLQTVRLHRGLNGVFSPPKVIPYDPPLLNSAETAGFDFNHLGVRPGDVISMFAEAVDTAPNPHLARSQTVRLLVISVEDYNNFLREKTDLTDTEAKYADLMEDLQRLIEEQKKLGEAADKLGEQLAKSANPTQREALTRELDGLLAKQNELNEKLNKHAGRMENFVRDNPLYDVEKDLQELLRERAKDIRQSANTNNATAGDIAARSSPPSGQRQLSPDMLAEFKKASDEQIKKLGGAREEAEKQIVEKLRDMSLMQELIKDFNQFEALYRAQQEVAAHAQAYNRPGELTREDQLALKELASTEKQVGDLLEQLEAKLRDDADAAAKLFPKASQSGRDMANKLDELRLRLLALQASGQMLAGNGEKSYDLAERLRSEMEKLFGDCQAGNCPSGNELDKYLRLQRMKPGNNFAQMSRSRKFGVPGMEGEGEGFGSGAAGTSGYAVMGGKMDVMGNEMMPSRGNATGKQSARQGKGAGKLAAASGAADTEKTDVVTGLNPVNRQSGAVESETTIEEYHDVVENYFKTITTKRKQ